MYVTLFDGERVRYQLQCSLTLTIHLEKCLWKTIKYISSVKFTVSDGHNSNLSIYRKHSFSSSSSSFYFEWMRESCWVGKGSSSSRTMKISSIMFIFRLYRLMSRFLVRFGTSFFFQFCWRKKKWEIERTVSTSLRFFFPFCMGQWTLNIVWKCVQFCCCVCVSKYFILAAATTAVHEKVFVKLSWIKEPLFELPELRDMCTAHTHKAIERKNEKKYQIYIWNISDK